jgi:hypothetical protein
MTQEHVILCQIAQISNKLLPELGMLGMIQLYKSRECSLPLITTTTTTTTTKKRSTSSWLGSLSTIFFLLLFSED